MESVPPGKPTQRKMNPDPTDSMTGVSPNPVPRWIRRLDWPGKLGCCDRIWGSPLARRKIVWIETAGGVVWKLDLANPTHRWLVYGDYQGTHLRNWCTRHLSHHPTLIVSGANIGQMIASLHPRLHCSRILAFEPDPEALKWLGECAARHPEIPLEISPSGLGEKSGTAPWKHADWNHSHGSQSRIDPSGEGRVPITRLDEALAQRQWPHTDLWILDIEGGELDALHGAGTLLKEHRIGALYMEVDPSPSSRNSVTYLESLGYRGHSLDHRGQPRTPGGVFSHGDLLFLPGKKT
jgi:FkbM family methyltransferase